MVVLRNASGKTEQDKIVEACSLYKATDETKRSFVLLQCWSLLRFNKKWLAQIDRSSQSSKKLESRSNASPSMSRSDTKHIDDSEATSRAKADHLRRPIGKKAEKERQCRGKNASSIDDSSIVMALNHVFSKRREVEEAREMARQSREMSREMARQSRELSREAGKRERYAGLHAIEQRKVEIQEVSHEMEIMNKDLSSMDEDQQEYYKMLRRDIIARQSKR